MSDFPGANLGALLSYGDGTAQTETEADILRVVFQTKGGTHYDRPNGGSFEDIEQERGDESVILLFLANVIGSVYRMNERRDFKPFVVLGYEDIKQDSAKGKFGVSLSYRLMQDLQAQNKVTVTQ